MKKFVSPLVALAGFLLLVGISHASPEPASLAATVSSNPLANITVESQNMQPITHWGFATRNRQDWNENRFSIVNYPNSLQALYNDSGANIVRLQIDPNIMSGNVKIYNAFKSGVLAATGRGMQWYALPWSPPAEYKTTGVVNGKDGSGNISYLKANYEDEVAVWLTSLLTRLKADGVPMPYAIGPQNEPDFAPPTYPGCVYSAIQQKRAVKELRLKLNAAGLGAVKVMGDDGASPYTTNANTGTISMSGLSYPGGFYYNDADYRNSLDIISTHTYDIHNGRYTAFPNSIQQFYDLTKRTGKPVWMTEWETRHEHTHSDWEVIAETMSHFNRDVSSMGFNAWFQWQVWNSDLYSSSTSFESGLHHQWVHDNGTTIQKRPLYYIFRKIWKNAPAGSTYVRRVTSSEPFLQGETKAANPASYRQDLSAFRSGGRTVVVLLNRDASETRTVQVKGMTGSSAKRYRYLASDATTTNVDMRDMGNLSISSGQTQSFTLLPQTITILVTN